MKTKNGLDLSIARAQKEDAQTILDYLNLVGGESDNLLFGANGFDKTAEDEARMIEHINASTASTMLVGKIGGEIACVGSLFSPMRERIAHQGDLALSVQKKFWGIGVGTLLIQELIHFARQNTQTKILHLGVRAENLHAIALYRKMGFEEIGVYRNFFYIDGQYFDEILMNLYL